MPKSAHLICKPIFDTKQSLSFFYKSSEMLHLQALKKSEAAVTEKRDL